MVIVWSLRGNIITAVFDLMPLMIECWLQT